MNKFVEDPETAEALKPWYRQFCKRPTFNDEYLPTFDRENVTLVDTSESRGVERIVKNVVIANRTRYEVDCIIFRRVLRSVLRTLDVRDTRFMVRMV